MSTISTQVIILFLCSYPDLISTRYELIFCLCYLSRLLSSKFPIDFFGGRVSYLHLSLVGFTFYYHSIHISLIMYFTYILFLTPLLNKPLTHSSLCTFLVWYSHYSCFPESICSHIHVTNFLVLLLWLFPLCGFLINNAVQISAFESDPRRSVPTCESRLWMVSFIIISFLLSAYFMLLCDFLLSFIAWTTLLSTIFKKCGRQTHSIFILLVMSKTDLKTESPWVRLCFVKCLHVSLSRVSIPWWEVPPRERRWGLALVSTCVHMALGDLGSQAAVPSWDKTKCSKLQRVPGGVRAWLLHHPSALTHTASPLPSTAGCFEPLCWQLKMLRVPPPWFPTHFSMTTDRY